MAASAGIISAVAGVASAYTANETRLDAKKAAGEAKQARVKAETDAAQRSSAQAMMARRALRQNSLFTGGGDAGAGAGRTTLGV